MDGKVNLFTLRNLKKKDANSERKAFSRGRELDVGGPLKKKGNGHGRNRKDTEVMGQRKRKTENGGDELFRPAFEGTNQV